MRTFADSFMKQVFLNWFVLVPAFFVGLVLPWLVVPFVVLSVSFVNWYVYGHVVYLPLKPIIDDGWFYLKILAFCYAFWLFLLFVKF